MQDFRLNWVSVKASQRGERPTNENISEMIELCKSFNRQIQKIIQGETVSWDTESRALQSELESKSQTANPSTDKPK